MDVTFNGMPVTNDNGSGYYLVVGYAQNPESFDTIVTFANDKQDARFKLMNQRANKSFTAIFVTKQTY